MCVRQKMLKTQISRCRLLFWALFSPFASRCTGATLPPSRCWPTTGLEVAALGKRRPLRSAGKRRRRYRPIDAIPSHWSTPSLIIEWRHRSSSIDANDAKQNSSGRNKSSTVGLLIAPTGLLYLPWVKIALWAGPDKDTQKNPSW